MVGTQIGIRAELTGVGKDKDVFCRVVLQNIIGVERLQTLLHVPIYGLVESGYIDRLESVPEVIVKEGCNIRVSICLVDQFVAGVESEALRDGVVFTLGKQHVFAILDKGVIWDVLASDEDWVVLVKKVLEHPSVQDNALIVRQRS